MQDAAVAHRRSAASFEGGGQSRVLELIASGAELETSLEELITAIEADLPSITASILLLDDDGVHLRHGAAPGLPAEFRKAIEDGVIGPTAGSCGTAAWRAEMVVVEDIARDPLWKNYRDGATACGMRACWSTPIFDRRHRVLGTFAMYLRRTGRPTESELKLIGQAAHVAAIAIERRREELALRRGEARYRGILEGMTIGFVAMDRDMRFTYVNLRAVEILGRPSAELLGSIYQDVFPEAIGSPFELAYRRAIAERVTVSTESYFPPWNRWFSQRVDAAPDGLLVFFEDITDRKIQQQKLERLSRVHAVTSGINSLIVRERNRLPLLGEACRIAVEVGGFRMAWAGASNIKTGRIDVIAACGTDDQYLERVPLSLVDSDPASFGLAGQALRDQVPVVVEDMANDPRITLHAEAQVRGIHSAAVLPLFASGKAFGVLAIYASEIGFFNTEEMKLLGELTDDVSFALEHIEKDEQANYLAFFDPLTGLANRSLFIERVIQNLQAAAHTDRLVGVAVVDIDRFKSINDSLGRRAGDELLRLVARRFLGFADEEPRVARLDRDQFAIAVPGLRSAEQAARLVEKRLKECFGPPFNVAGTELRVAVKVGIALSPDDGNDAEALLRNAESALKNAKKLGEKYLFYAPTMNSRVAERLTLENKLRLALEREEFVAHYQPKVDVLRRQIVGMEALIRWKSPDLGLVPPANFIPLLEETGLIIEVGAWMLERAVRDHRRWIEGGIAAPRIAVNVSPAQLRAKNFVAMVELALLEGSTQPGLDLEITESVIMHDIESNIAKLKQIRALGLGVAIDDFGTGYSSLAYLAQLPVESMKIDRSFISAMRTDSYAMTLVSTIIQMAHSLGLTVVAEGVETDEQADTLGELKCDQLQGYLFGRPQAFEDTTTLLSKL